MDTEQRIDLEMRLVFQEDTIAKLNDALVSQQRQLDELSMRLKRLIESLERPSELPEFSLEHERPPHY